MKSSVQFALCALVACAALLCVNAVQLQDSPFVIPSNWKAAEKGVVGSSSPTQARSGAPKLGKGVSSSLVNGTQSAGKYEIDIDWVVVNFLYSYYSENKQKVTDALVMDIAQSENVGVEQVAIRGVEPMRLFTPRSPKISLVETDSAAVAGADSERYMISGIRVFASIKVESETMAKMVARHLLSSIRDRTVSLTTLEDLPSASRGNDDLGFALDWNRSTVTYQGNLVSDHYGVEVANKALEMGKATNGATKSIQDYVNQLKKAIVQSGEVNDAILEATKLTDHSDEWDYLTNGLNWEGLCKTGYKQSPINIDTKSAVALPKNYASLVTNLNYHISTGLSLINTGRMFQVAGNFGQVQLKNGQVYNALRISFKSSSEHVVDGTHNTMEMQILHQKVGSTGNKGLLISSVFFTVSDTENPFLSSLGWTSAPLSKGSIPITGNVDLKMLETSFNGEYYSYSGSMTTPTCDEDVAWVVFRERQPMNKNQFQTISSRFPKGNHREVQPLNGRTVFKAKKAKRLL